MTLQTMRMPLHAALLALMLVVGPAASAAAQKLRSFDAESLDQIRATHPGKAFILAFWSTQCVPCRDEMAQLRTLKRKFPTLQVILVATDAPSQAEGIKRFLARYDPGPVQRWAFADEFSERVRYAVDPAWRGELPRTYFYDAAHRAVAKSGLIDAVWIENWVAAQESGRR